MFEKMFASTGTFVVEARSGLVLPAATVRLLRVRDGAANNFTEIAYDRHALLEQVKAMDEEEHEAHGPLTPFWWKASEVKEGTERL